MKKSNELKKSIKKNKKKHEHSVEFKKGDLFYSVQHCHYTIKSVKGKKVKIKAHDRYDFTEFRRPLNTMANVANNLGYLLERNKITYPYSWSVNFSIRT